MKSGYRWTMLGLGWLVYFSFGMAQSSLPPLVSIIRRDLNLTYSEFGAILGAWQAIYIVASSVEGIMLDRFGIRKSIAVAALLLSLSVFLRSLARDFTTLFIAVAVFGLGGPLISIGLPKLIAQWFSGGERGTAAGIYTTGSTMGSSFALAITNSVILPLAGSWQNTFCTYAVGGVLIAVLWYVLAHDSPDTTSKREVVKNASTTETFKEMMRSKDVWLVVTIGFAGFCVQHGLRNWLPAIYELNGLTQIEAGFLASIPQIFGMIGAISINRMVANMTSRKPAVLVVLAMGGIGTYLVATSVGAVLWVAIVIWGFCYGALLPLLMLVLMDMRDVGRERMGGAGGLYFTIGEIGGFGGPLLMGYIKDYWGSFLPGIIVFAIITEIMLVPTFILNEQRDNKS